MGDSVRLSMSRSMHAGSPKKDNAEEVARRREAMQRELELRREEAKRLQEQKMARATAQKEERLQRQRDLQQREAQRFQAAQQRRTAALAEEKLKKATVMAKVEQAAQRAAAQQKSRPVYAFGSSTPRELGYLTLLTKQQQVYDRKLLPAAGRISSPTLNTVRHSSASTNGYQMTRSMYIPGKESPHHATARPLAGALTRSVISPQQPSRNSPKLPYTPRLTPARETARHSASSASATQVQRLNNGTRGQKTSTPKDSGKAKEKTADAIGNQKVLKGGFGKNRSPVSNSSVNENGGNSGTENMDRVKQADAAQNVAQALAEEPAQRPLEDHWEKEKEEILQRQPELDHMHLVHPEVQNISKVVEEEEQKTEELEENKEVVSSDMREEGLTDSEQVRGASDETMAYKENDKNGLIEIQKVEEVPPDSQVPVKSREGFSEVDNNPPVATIREESALPSVSNEIREEGSLPEEEMRCDSEIDVPQENGQNREVDGQEAEEVSAERVLEGASIDNLSEGNGNLTTPVTKSAVSSSVNEVEVEMEQSKETHHAEGKKSGEERVVEERERAEALKYEAAQREREERKARLAAIMSRTRGAPTAVVNPTTQNIVKESISSKDLVKENGTQEAADAPRVASAKTASILQKLASSNPQLMSSNPHLMSLLQRNGSNPSLADELMVADQRPPSYGQSDDRLNMPDRTSIHSFDGDTDSKRTLAFT